MEMKREVQGVIRKQPQLGMVPLLKGVKLLEAQVREQPTPRYT